MSNVTQQAPEQTRRQIALDNEVLRCQVGSTAYGTTIPGTEDKDYLGIFIEPPVNVIGLRAIDHYIYRDADEGERSQAGELDLTLYSLRKFANLALKGNPSVLNLFWAPVDEETWPANNIRGAADLFISKRVYLPFRGYMHRQLERLKGERGQKRVKRPELEKKYGHDTKYAYHVLRLGFQGIELLETGKMQFPMEPGSRQLLLNVRQGVLTYEEVIDYAKDLEFLLERAYNLSGFPDEPNSNVVNEWLTEMYFTYWEANGLISTP